MLFALFGLIQKSQKGERYGVMKEWFVNQHKGSGKEKLRNLTSIRETMANLAEKTVRDDAKKGVIRDYSYAKRIGI